MSPRSLAGLLCTASLLLAPAAARASATIGQTAAPNVNGCSAFSWMQLNGGAGSPAYSVPANGTITSWSYQANDFGGSIALQVFRFTGTVNQFTLVAESNTESVITDQLDTFSTSIPVLAGDQIALGVKSSAPACWFPGGPGDTIGLADLPAIGDVAGFSPCGFGCLGGGDTTGQALLDVSAVLEGATAQVGAAPIPPVVTAINPTSGPSDQSTLIDIRGSFTGHPQVLVDGAALPADQVVSNGFNDISAVLPPHAPGTVDVQVRNEAGTSPTTPADQFTYVAKPTTPSLVAPKPVCGQMPNLVGLTYRGAKKAMKDAGCNAILQHTGHAKHGRSHVLTQSPAAGAALPAGVRPSIALG
jgi:hypothetical protein